MYTPKSITNWPIGVGLSLWADSQPPMTAPAAFRWMNKADGWMEGDSESTGTDADHVSSGART